jgi:hypothetical protein
MKPTSQISSNQRSFPSTDFHYQSTMEAGGSSPTIPEKGISELRTFRKLSSEFFGTETSRDYVAELLLFSSIAGVSAWSIASMIATLARMIK